MNGNVIGTFISFWAFMIGVLFFGKVFGFMEDTKTTTMIIVGAIIAFVVWTVGRNKAAQRRENQEWEAGQAKARKGKGGKR